MVSIADLVCEESGCLTGSTMDLLLGPRQAEDGYLPGRELPLTRFPQFLRKQNLPEEAIQRHLAVK